MKKIKSICVYCGSSVGEDLNFTEAAIDLAQSMISRDIELVYGGTNKGLMKIIADELINGGKTVTGVTTESFVAMGLSHPNITKTIIVNTITERRAKMLDIADGFIALPGGIGTFREIFELLSFTQLDILRKPCGVLNISCFYDLMIQTLDYCVKTGFILQEHKDILLISNNSNELLEMFSTYESKIDHRYFDQKYALNNNTICHEI